MLRISATIGIIPALQNIRTSILRSYSQSQRSVDKKGLKISLRPFSIMYIVPSLWIKGSNDVITEYMGILPDETKLLMATSRRHLWGE